jgi:hypothetical protein
VPPSTMPAPSLTNVRLTDETVVAVTATVPVADVAFADGETKAAAIATTIASDNFRPFFMFFSWVLRLTASSFLDKVPQAGRSASDLLQFQMGTEHWPIKHTGPGGVPLNLRESPVNEVHEELYLLICL